MPYIGYGVHRYHRRYRMACCYKCDTELTKDNWAISFRKRNQKICKKCYNELFNDKHSPLNNPRRMYVNGKYISRKHPLYKPGTYKSFDEAMFASITKDKKITDGHIYLISNPHFSSLGWYKIGKAVDVEDRCDSYQTSTPFRDFYIIDYVSVNEYSKAEKEAKDMAHRVSNLHNKDTNGEWFDAKLEDLLSIINTVGAKYNKRKELSHAKTGT